MRSIGVVGGGIIGLATVQAILEDFTNVSVTVYSSDFSPDTTADVSAGWIFPYLTGLDESHEDLAYWTKSTIEHLAQLAKDSTNMSKVIFPISGYLLYKNEPIKLLDSANKCFPNKRFVDQDELRRVTGRKYAGAIFITTWSCDPSYYLPYVMETLKRKGVKFVKERINSLDDIAERGHDIVVNSAGYDSKYLANDPYAQPIKGQVIVVRAPWIKHFLTEEDGDSYTIPKRDTVVVGGTHSHDESIAVDSETSKRIWDDACKMYPALRGAKILRHAAGIRPGRSKIRMEVEEARTRNGKQYMVLHHYGHGGSGVTMHWGCAKQASRILKRHLWRKNSHL